MTGSHGENETRVPMRIRNWFFEYEGGKLALKQMDSDAIDKEFVPNIRAFAQPAIGQGHHGINEGHEQSNGGDPDPCVMAAGLALCLCESGHYTGQNDFRFLELLEKCFNSNKNAPQLFPLDQLILSLCQTESIKAIDAYFPIIAAYQSKNQRTKRKIINYNVKNMDQLILANFFTDHPAFPRDWLPKVRILRKTLKKGIENLKSAYESERKQKETIDKGFTAWACDWALAMQSSIAGARANSVASTDFIDEVDRVRVQLSILQNPHRWIADIMAPCLDAAAGTQKKLPEMSDKVEALEMPLGPVEQNISPILSAQISITAEGQQTAVKDILDKLPGGISNALKICADYVNSLIKAEEHSRLQREKSEEALRAAANAMGEADKLRSKIDDLEKDHEIQAKKIEGMKKQTSDEKLKWEDAIRQLSSVQASLVTKNGEITILKEDAIKQLSSFHSNLACKNDEITSLKAEAGELRSFADSMRNQVGRLEQEKNVLKDEYERQMRISQNNLNETRHAFHTVAESRIAEAKSNIRSRIASDFHAIEQLFAAIGTQGASGPSPQTWSIFAKKIREELGFDL